MAQLREQMKVLFHPCVFYRKRPQHVLRGYLTEYMVLCYNCNQSDIRNSLKTTSGTNEEYSLSFQLLPLVASPFLQNTLYSPLTPFLSTISSVNLTDFLIPDDSCEDDNMV